MMVMMMAMSDGQHVGATNCHNDLGREGDADDDDDDDGDSACDDDNENDDEDGGAHCDEDEDDNDDDANGHVLMTRMPMHPTVSLQFQEPERPTQRSQLCANLGFGRRAYYLGAFVPNKVFVPWSNFKRTPVLSKQATTAVGPEACAG